MSLFVNHQVRLKKGSIASHCLHFKDRIAMRSKVRIDDSGTGGQCIVYFSDLTCKTFEGDGWKFGTDKCESDTEDYDDNGYVPTVGIGRFCSGQTGFD